jgi:hypothetical protein
MPVSQETQLEIDSALHSRGRLPQGYIAFMVKWMAFNRAYNELEDKSGDWKKVAAVAENHKERWLELIDLATELVSIECIGSEPIRGSDLVAPKPIVKAATLFLRENLGLVANVDTTNCAFSGCERDEKRRICNLVAINQPWNQSELTALLRLVYQVRCNLMHGEKRIRNNDQYQTNRDRELIRISSQILDHVLRWLLQ